MNQNSLILFVLFLFYFVSQGTAANVLWEPYTQAQSASGKDNKPVFVELYADWCMPCREMAQTTFQNPAVVKLLNTRFHPVKLDAESENSIVCGGLPKTVNRCFFDVWKLQGIPSYVFIDKNGNVLLTLTDFFSAGDMKNLLLDVLDKEKSGLLE